MLLVKDDFLCNRLSFLTSKLGDCIFLSSIEMCGYFIRIYM